MRRNIIATLALLSIALSAMAQTPPTQSFPVSSRVWSGAQTFGPATRPAAAYQLVSIQMAGPTDWQTGAAGRVILMTIQKSLDGGQTWKDSAGNGPVGQISPNMGKHGEMPTLLESDISMDPQGTLYRININCSAPVTCGWLITIWSV